MDADLKARIAAHQKQMQKNSPGINITFSSAVRSLIEKGLEAQ